MYIHLKDSTIKVTEVVAVTKTIIPATNFTPKYFAMCVYVKGIEPIIHTYVTEDERDNIYKSIKDILIASETGNEITN